MDDAIKMARSMGIEKVNLDFMYGLKHQSPNTIKTDLEVIHRLCPDQVTLYELRTNMISEESHTTAAQRYEYYKLLYYGLMDMGYCSHFGQNTFSMDSDDIGVSSYIRHRMMDCKPYKGFGISAQSMNSEGVAYNVGKNGHRGIVELEHVWRRIHLSFASS